MNPTNLQNIESNEIYSPKLKKLGLVIFALAFMNGCDFNHRSSRIEQKIIPVTQGPNFPSYDEEDFAAAKNPNGDSDQNNHDKNNIGRVQYEFRDIGKPNVDPNDARGKDATGDFYQKNAYQFPKVTTETLSAGSVGGKPEVIPDSKNVTTLVVKFPGWKPMSNFSFPVHKFTKGAKSIFLVPMLDYVPEDYLQSIKIWAAQEAAKVEANAKFSIRYEDNDICNENNESKVLFPDQAQNKPIFIRDMYNNIVVNSEIFIKDFAHCKELKAKIKSKNVLQKNEHVKIFAQYGFLKIDNLIFDNLKLLNSKISVAPSDLTQNEYSDEHDKMRFAVEYVCSRRAQEYGPFFCPILVGQGLKDLKSDAFKEFKNEVYWTERTEYMIYSSLTQLDETKDIKRKEE